MLQKFTASYGLSGSNGLRTEKSAKNATFFCKERKNTQRTQRTQRSFAKNVKERENVSFFCKRMQNVPFFFQYIYIDI